MSIQISGPGTPADGSVTAAKINSVPAVDGQVLTADGAGGAAFETVQISDGSVGPRQLSDAYTRVTRVLADNLDSFTTIDFGQRKVLRYSLPNHRGVAIVTLNYTEGFSSQTVGAAFGSRVFMSAETTPTNYSKKLTMVVFEDYTRATRCIDHPGAETGGVQAGQIYADGSGLLYGWYFGDAGPFVAAAGKGCIESAWLTENTLNIAIKSAATSGGPFTLQGDLWIVY